MKNKSGMIWSFIFFIVMAGCSTHQQLAGNEPAMAVQTPQAQSLSSSSAKTEPATTQPTPPLQDEEGYQLRSVDIAVEHGRPYLPVGAEFITQDGKVALGDVIKALADHKGFSVSWADDVDQQRPVDCYIKAADNFYDSLDNILRQLDYYYEIQGDTIIVGYKETKKYLLAMPNFTEGLDTFLGGDMLPKGESEAGLQAFAKLEIKSEEFNFWDDLNEMLTNIVNCDGCPAPVIDKNLGTITVTASKKVHKNVEKHLALIERQAYKQVIIEAKIIEVTLSEDHAKGIDWESVLSGPGLTGKAFGGRVELGDESGYLWQKDLNWNRFLNGITISDVTWDVVVSAFEIFGDTRIVANPKVHILNGHGAVLSAGQVRKYLEGCDVTTSEFGTIELEAKIAALTEGLSIGLKANITDDKEVVLYVFPAITRLIEMRDIFSSACGEIQAPEMAVREMATYAKVKDGEILVIGGLIQEGKDKETKKVPVLGDLPYLDKIFSYERVGNEKRELVILLKPKIKSLEIGPHTTELVAK